MVSTLKGVPPLATWGMAKAASLPRRCAASPNSVVLLDEVEKVHQDVHEIFFQVFDKGWMEDAEGRYIDFRNTLILPTTNVGTELLIMGLCKDPALMPEPDGIANALRQSLLKTFPAALVAIPYYPLNDEMLAATIRLQLGRIAERIEENHGVPFTYGDAVVALIAERCREVESGARVVDAILTNTVLPAISQEILERTLAGDALGRVGISVVESGFAYAFDWVVLTFIRVSRIDRVRRRDTA